MTPQWALELSGGAPPEIIVRAVRLASTPWVTPERIRRVLDSCLDRSDVATEGIVEALERAAGAAKELANEQAVERTAHDLLRHGAKVHIAGHPGYPAKLAGAWPELGAPLWIFVQSSSGALPDGPAVAVVGSRHPTLDGIESARELARLLARHGVVVVSGMARGIDQAAHLAAIRSGGATVGVLGTGFGVDYPRRDAPVRDAVASAGGLVSELLPGTPPHRATFLWRNRIIAGLADATVVVEGQARSGSLQTARMAAGQGRDVWAVPGSPRSPNSRAPLDLIRDGAIALTRIEDALDLLGLTPQVTIGTAEQPPLPGVTGTGAVLLPLLGAVPASPSALAAASHLPLPKVLAAVGELTNAGLAAATPRGIVRTAR